MWFKFSIISWNTSIVPNEFETKSDIKIYHPYLNNWKLIVEENLQARIEPDNIMNKYIMAVLKNTYIIGYLTKGKSGRYAKTIFCCLQDKQLNVAVVTVREKN